MFKVGLWSGRGNVDVVGDLRVAGVEGEDDGGKEGG